MTAAPTNDRIDPPYVADERAMLDGWLDFHRETLAIKCHGLTPDQLRTASVPPSDLTLLGLVRHLANCERGWFRVVVAGESVEPCYDDGDPDADLHPPADADLIRQRIDGATGD